MTAAKGGARLLGVEPWDPLLSRTSAELYWATSNLGEATPGVQTPLSWTLWWPALEHALRDSLFKIGTITRAERRVPAQGDQRLTRPFFGRPAVQVQTFALVGDRMPGTSGPEAIRSILGRVPEDIAYTPSRRRYPVIAWRLPTTFARQPGRIRALANDCAPWYSDAIEEVQRAHPDELRGQLLAAARRHDEALVAQAIGLLGVVQPLHDLVARLVERIGAGDLSLLTGPPGGAEMAVVGDIWRASRGELSLDEVVRRHGFHGPLEGELSSRVWREDRGPLRAMVNAYAERDASHDPIEHDRARRAAHAAAESELLRAAPSALRPVARQVLGLARERLPMRGVAKRAFLQAFDVARAASRRLGVDLAERGSLDTPDDVFYLTWDELTGELPPDARDLVARRRERHEIYRSYQLPELWKGAPQPERLPDPTSARVDALTLQGIGVSAGVVEGYARVLQEPDFEAVEPDEILVAPTTDPSWASIMFISQALVVDIGGALSHAAVVARELGIPCVVNVRDATHRLRTGDRIRVDGRTGTVEILERVA